MEIVDTHCHLYFDQLKPRLDEVVASARAASVTRMVCVGATLDESAQAAEIAASCDGVWASIGVHPHAAQDFLDNSGRLAEIDGLLARPKVVAVGEIGLDYYKSQTPKAVQEKALREQIEAGSPSGLPFIFHVRDAWSDFWRIFDGYKNLTGVIHSFSSGVKQLDAALERGLYVGLNGIMTFTKDHAQLEAARRVPASRLLLETDAPFLTPEPFRGLACEPKHTVATADFLAGLRDEPVRELAKSSTDNALRLFKLS